MSRPREFDEAEVVDRAMRLFWARGYEATSVDDLCAATGLNRSSLYRSFGSKRELLEAALTAYQEFAHARTARLLDDNRPIQEGVRRFLLGLFDDKDRGEAEWGCLLGNTSSELAARDDAARRTLRGSLERVEAALHDALARARARGEISPDADVAGLARFLTAQAQGMRLIAKNKPSPAVLRDIVQTTLKIVQ